MGKPTSIKPTVRIAVEKVTKPGTVKEEKELVTVLEFNNASTAFFAMLSLQHRVSDILDPDEEEVQGT